MPPNQSRPRHVRGFHLVMDAIDRLPQTGDKGIYVKQQLKDPLIEPKRG
jgi:xylulose-5-phosphate/fructose-6-phosphate phosphoketolase